MKDTWSFCGVRINTQITTGSKQRNFVEVLKVLVCTRLVRMNYKTPPRYQHFWKFDKAPNGEFLLSTSCFPVTYFTFLIGFRKSFPYIIHRWDSEPPFFGERYGILIAKQFEQEKTNQRLLLPRALRSSARHSMHIRFPDWNHGEPYNYVERAAISFVLWDDNLREADSIFVYMHSFKKIKRGTSESYCRCWSSR